MGIDYLQVRNQNLETIGIIDTANSIIWNKKYYGCGEFEIYMHASVENVNLLQRGYYVTRLNDDEVGVIEKFEVSENPQDGRMVVATGRFAKSILERRIIYRLAGKQNRATVLQGNVESAARALVANNCTYCTWNTNRNIPILQLGAHSGSTQIIVDGSGNPTKKQVTNDNLLTYTDALLQEYSMSAKIVLSDDESKLEYVCFQGIDRSMNNSSGIDSVIFSTDFQNLAESKYTSDDYNLKNMALIGGEGEGLDRFYSSIEGAKTGLARRELFINASNIQRTYTDDNDEEQTYTDAEYKAMLDSRGKLKLAQMIEVESFSGTINTSFGNWLLNRDYEIGDIVTVQNNDIGIYANVRIVETTEVQDENGYTISVSFE